MPERCTNPECLEHWPAPMPLLLPALEAATPSFEKALMDAAERSLVLPHVLYQDRLGVTPDE